MASLDLGEDDGYYTIKIGDAEATVDVWQTRSRLAELVKKHKDGTDEQFFAAILDVMREAGFPPASHRLAQKFADAIFARAKELGEESGSGVESQGSTPGPTLPGLVRAS